MNPQHDQLAGRYWPTAKALRALGQPVPADVFDDEPVVFVSASPLQRPDPPDVTVIR